MEFTTEGDDGKTDFVPKTDYWDTEYRRNAAVGKDRYRVISIFIFLIARLDHP